MNSNILIKNVLLGNEHKDILISGNRFKKIVPTHPAGENSACEDAEWENSACEDAEWENSACEDAEWDSAGEHSAGEHPAGAESVETTVIDAAGMAILPAFYNTHTHAAMSLLRGYADDMPLQKWLQEYIWPYEDKLTPEDIETGSEIAIKEMIKGGTVFFNDMYFDIEKTISIVEKTGIRASIGITVMENHSRATENLKHSFVDSWKDPTGGRIQLTIAPHAIYTVGTEKLIRSAEWARNNGLRLTIHLSETAREVQDCLKEHGMTPVRYLDSIGFLGSDVIAAHCVHVDAREWDILAERGVTVSHCPCSNMKLGSGRFPYELAIRSGAKITLGTDGCSSNNNLDMREEMKFAALLAKCVSAQGSDGETLANTGNPSILPADEILRWATVNGAEAFGIDAGTIEEGKIADCILVDMSGERMNPNHHIVSNWVYSASSSCVKTVICDGRIISG
jgi:Cytosine deaminase and related metal-dependent hydrolases